MSVGSGVPYNAHTGNGVTTVFAYGFTLLDAADLVVTIAGVVTSSYTVSGVGAAAGGFVTFSTAPANGAAILLQRMTQLVRATEYPTNGDLLAETVNRDFDRLWMALQNIGADGTRAIRVPEIGVLPALPAASDRALSLLGFNAAGDPIPVAPVSGSASELALDLVSTAAGKGASIIGIEDAAGNFPDAAQTVEGALARLAGRFYGEDVRKHGALLDGTTDDTGAINAATATGRPVFIPFTLAGCVVNDALVRDGMTVFGERIGSFGGSMLIVTASNKAAFKHSTAAELYNVRFQDLSCKSASAALTGTAFFSQTDMSRYTAYATFENIETWLNLTCAYKLWPIFTDWINCRTGYFGTAGARHSFIECLPAAYGQSNATNINTVQRCKVFNCVGGSAAIDVGYGALWSFRDTDFENLAVRAFRGRALQNVNFDWCWFEGQNGGTAVAEYVLLDIWPATAAAAYPVNFRNCWGVIPNITGQFVNMASSLCQANFEDSQFGLVPAGVRLTNLAASVGYQRNCLALSGDGAAGFFTGHPGDTYASGKRLLNGAADNGGGATFQQAGTYSAEGFTSTFNNAVGTSFLDIAAVPAAGLVFVNASNNSGGSQGWWLLGVLGTGSLVTTIASQNSTGLTASFQLSGGKLQARVAAGSMTVSAAVLR